MNDTAGDLVVTAISDALKGRRIDVVVSGSIAAVEGVRFIRALRRLGADVTPWLTKGGSQFVTPMALEWAAGRPCIQAFSGTATHIATGDAVIVAPASSNIINQLATGATSTPSTALVASALGQKKPVLVLPAMHDSLAQAPSHLQNLATLSTWSGVHILPSRLEEGKRKFPEPAVLADVAAHLLNQSKRPAEPVLLTMGTTRGYIDDVRYLSNYSSGKLGSTVASELYRQGFQTHVVCGPCEYKPQVFSKLIAVATTSEMLNACLQAEADGLSGGIFAASVLDFEPALKTTGKIRSTQNDLTVTLKPTPKIVGRISLAGKPKFAFKLEVGLTEAAARAIARDYGAKYGLSGLVANDLSTVSATTHHGWAVSKDGNVAECSTKQSIAQWIIAQLCK